MGKKEQRNITIYTSSFGNAFQVKFMKALKPLAKLVV